MSQFEASSRLLIELECRRINESIGYFLDERRYDELIACFTPDARIVRNGVEAIGRGEILALLVARSASVRTRHCPTNYRFEHIDDLSVRAVIYNLTFLGVGDEPRACSPYASQHPMFVEYHDVYRYGKEGWLLAEREMWTALGS